MPQKSFNKSAVLLMFLIVSIGTVSYVEAQNTWSLTGSMSTARSGHRAILLSDGRVLVIGGYSGSSQLASAEIYDPVLGTWSLTGSMSTARSGTATLLSDGRVLVTGGLSGSGVLASAEIYDPVLGTWSLTASMSTARFKHTATLLSDGRVLVTGGVNFSSHLASAEIYDPVLGTWSLTDSMSSTRGAFQHAATLLLDGRVLVSGSGLSSFAEIYDPVLGTWSLTGSLAEDEARYDHTATLLQDGRVLINGGSYEHSGDQVGTAEIYDPVLGTWSLTDSTSGRYLHTATLLSDGRVLVSGGWEDDYASLPFAEIYDPVLGTWSGTDSMTTARHGHTATLLSDGRVLVSGGTRNDGSLAYLASAEIYSPDTTPPQVSCDPADGAWHDSDVTIACTASDPESGLANAADASFNLTTNVPVGTETADAVTNSREVCNTIGACTTAGPITGNKVDRKPPTITITSPAADATYQVNAVVGANYDCADGGSGVASCQGPVANGSPIDTSSAGTKTFTVTATDTAGNPSTLTVTYSVALTLSIGDVTIVEGNAGSKNAVFTVSLSAASSQTVTVNYAVAAGTATEGSDFVSSSGARSFAPGMVTRTISIPVVGDQIDEVNETFFVNLSAATNASLVDSQALGTITDNDTSTISIGDITAIEGDGGTTAAVFTVFLSVPSSRMVTVDYATGNGTAKSGVDYQAASGGLTFVPGATSQTFTILVNADIADEKNEVFHVTLANPSEATIGDSRARAIIVDDDAPPAVSIGDITVVEGNKAATTVVLTLTLSTPSNLTVIVGYQTANGTATTPDDYKATSGHVTFPAGTVSRTITIRVARDLVDEVDETFFVNLFAPLNVTIGDGQAVITIVDNDP